METKQGHTPGPWHARPRPPQNINSEHNGDPFTIASGEMFVAAIKTHPESEANARLIAAAPELLEALEALTDSFIHTHGNDKGNKAKTYMIQFNDDVRDALNAARAAIAKATEG